MEFCSLAMPLIRYGFCVASSATYLSTTRFMYSGMPGISRNLRKSLATRSLLGQDNGCFTPNVGDGRIRRDSTAAGQRSTRAKTSRRQHCKPRTEDYAGGSLTMTEQARPDESSERDLLFGEGSTGLVVLVHGFGGSRETMNDVVDVIHRARPDCAIFPYKYYCNFLSFDDPSDIVLDLKAKVDGLVARRGYRDIVLIGYSMGALLTRKLYVCACGENSDAPFEPPLAGPCATVGPWAHHVSRIVLLAGMNRGWTIDHHSSIPRAVLWSAGVLIGNAIWAVRYLLSRVTARISPRPPLIFTIRHGATFITQLRIQWLSMRRHSAPKRTGKALTVQLLGTVDDLVSPEDNIDIVTGADFVYLEIPHSGHLNMVQMGAQPRGAERAAVLNTALTSKDTDLSSLSVPLADTSPTSPDSTVQRVVFVIHGIRDLGYWTRKIAGRVKTRAGKHPVASITSSYGYFPMLSFLLPTRRRAKVQWLMDQYTEALARYPNANFYYVGHSNGTYLLARALEVYTSVHFDRVVFAGSVVRRCYDWTRFMPPNSNPQVNSVLNYVATGDWVVAIFPKAIQTLRLQDLGSAGHDGFAGPGPRSSIHQIEYVPGSHGAALAEDCWNEIADFINSGTVPQPQEFPRHQCSRDPLVVLLGWFAPLVWVLIGYAVFALGRSIYFGIQGDVPRTLALLVYGWLCWKILTRV
jgi:pimeloyl-ACP methyl ester carboxylesterase